MSINKTIKKDFSGNKDVLYGYAEKLNQKMSRFTEGQSTGYSMAGRISSLWSRLTSWLPSSERAGQTVGGAYARTYGPDMCNRLIDGAWARLLPTHSSSSYSGMFKNLLIKMAQKGASTTTKLTFTPKIVMIFELVGIQAGGFAGPAAVALLNVLYGKLAGANNRHTLSELPPLDQLLQLQADEDGNILGPNQELILDKRDVEELRKLMVKYNTVCKLIEFIHSAESENANIEELISKEFIIDHENVGYYRDGRQISEDEKDVIAEAVTLLESQNKLGKGNAILAMLKNFSKHHPKEIKQPYGLTPLKKTDRQQAQDENGNKLWCDPKGEVVFGDKLVALVDESDKREKAIDKVIKEFAMLDPNEPAPKVKWFGNDKIVTIREGHFQKSSWTSSLRSLIGWGQRR